MSKNFKTSVLHSAFFSIVVILVLTLGIGVIDYATVYKLSFSVFYVLPILIAARKFGRKGGTLSALLSALVWLFVDLFAHKYSYLHFSTPYWNVCLRFLFYLILVYLFTSWSKEAVVARIDSLTGIANHKGFYEFAEAEVKRCQRYKRPISIAFLDLDDFKLVNDQLGHQMGDQLLCTVAKIIKKATRETDFIARLGGDEFAILMPETGADAARAALSRLQKIFNVMEKNVWPGTCSIGAATFMQPPASVDEMIKAADALMYSGKRTGKAKTVNQIFKIRNDSEGDSSGRH